MSGQVPLWDPLGPDRLLRELEGWSARKAVVKGWQRLQPDFLQVQHAEGQQDCLQLQRRSDGCHQMLLPPAALAMAPARLMPLQQLLAMAAALGFPHQGGAPLALQLLDEQPRGRDALHFDAPEGESAPQWGVVPDPYCLASRGFMLLRQAWRKQALPPWNQRGNSVIWRGSTTGFSMLDQANLEQLPRYQICRRMQRLPGCDARFVAVVQAVTVQMDQHLQQRLNEEQLLTVALPPEAMAQSRWLLDVDGNVNSWGLLWKMLSGCCVLRVQSARAQWFHHRVRPMQHWVPIRADLSDLEERIDWCRSHPLECAAIADGGQRLAVQVLEELGTDLLTALRWAAQQETTRPSF